MRQILGGFEGTLFRDSDFAVLYCADNGTQAGGQDARASQPDSFSQGRLPD